MVHEVAKYSRVTVLESRRPIHYMSTQKLKEQNQNRTNLFAAARKDKWAMRPFATNYFLTPVLHGMQVFVDTADKSISINKDLHGRCR